MRKAFITYIRPLLEYASSIWSPTQAGLIDKVESVQRQFNKRILALQELSYRDRLSALNLELLEHHRLHLESFLCIKSYSACVTLI